MQEAQALPEDSLVPFPCYHPQASLHEAQDRVAVLLEDGNLPQRHGSHWKHRLLRRLAGTVENKLARTLSTCQPSHPRGTPSRAASPQWSLWTFPPAIGSARRPWRRPPVRTTGVFYLHYGTSIISKIMYELCITRTTDVSFHYPKKISFHIQKGILFYP